MDVLIVSSSNLVPNEALGHDLNQPQLTSLVTANKRAVLNGLLLESARSWYASLFKFSMTKCCEVGGVSIAMEDP